MRKDDFQDSAKAKGKASETGKGAGTATVMQFKVQPMSLRPPVPKPPFGMPIMPVAMNIKALPSLVQKKEISVSQRLQEEDSNE